MLRMILMIVLSLMAAVVQSSFVSMLPYVASAPNLLLILTFSVGILRGRSEGLWYGLLCGLLMDMFSGGYFGFYGMIYMYIGFLCGFVHLLIESDVPLIPIIFAILSEILYHGYVFVCRFLIRGRLNFGSYMNSIILPELCLTLFFAVLVYGLVSYGNTALERYEQRSALKFV